MFAMSAHADTETVNWYKDGQTYAQTTCTVGGDITLPTAPTKRGYNFTGWTVALYDFSTLDYTVNGDSFASNRTQKTWVVSFIYGTIQGRSLCSISLGGIPNEVAENGDQCWCRATGYIPNNSDIIYKPITTLNWVHYNNNTSPETCAANCADFCGYLVKNQSGFRHSLFGI